MKVKVVYEYRDKETGELKKLGTVHEYKPDRAQELIAGGFVEAVIEAKKPAEKKPAKKTTKK